MSFSYNPQLVTTKDRVRLLTGDTSEGKAMLSDEEIAFMVLEFGPDLYQVALAALDVMIVQAARWAEDKSVGPLSLSWGDRSKKLMAARASVAVMSMRKSGAPMPYAGGISVADKDVQDEDTDRVKPSFGKGMFDNVGGADERNLETERDRDWH